MLLLSCLSGGLKQGEKKGSISRVLCGLILALSEVHLE